jgi:hypothetical protein
MSVRPPGAVSEATVCRRGALPVDARQPFPTAIMGDKGARSSCSSGLTLSIFPDKSSPAICIGGLEQRIAGLSSQSPEATASWQVISSLSVATTGTQVPAYSMPTANTCLAS